MKRLVDWLLPNLAFIVVAALFIIAGNLIFGMVGRVSFLSNFWQNCWEDGIVFALGLLIGGATRIGVATWIKKGGN